MFGPPFSPSVALGVAQCGSRTAASVKVVPECRPESVEYARAPLAFASVAVAVGHCAAAPFKSRFPRLYFPPPFAPIPAVAVGQDIESLSAVRRADFFRSVQSRRNSVAQRL